MEKPKIVRQEIGEDGLVVSPQDRPTDYYDRYVKAKQHLAAGEAGIAIRIYADLVRKEPASVDPYVGLAACHTWLGNFQAAVEACRKAIQIDSQVVAPWIALGTAWLRLGQADQAAAGYRAALALDGDSGDAHWGMVLACAELGEVREARRHLERCRALIPDSQHLEELQRLVERIQSPPDGGK